jgi:salicylate hydroxylase
MANKVLIVGGGIVGPVAALLLQQKGWEPAIVEKVKKVGESGLATAIHPNG